MTVSFPYIILTVSSVGMQCVIVVHYMGLVVLDAVLLYSFVSFILTKTTQCICLLLYNTVSHFSYAPLFQDPHFLTKMLEPIILYDNLFIDILSV